MKKVFGFLLEIFKIVIIALLIVIPIRYFLFQPFFVKGESMEPTFENNNYLIIDEISYRFRAPSRGEVIVFKSPFRSDQRFIKRIIGLPGETITIKKEGVEISNNSGKFILNESAYLPSSTITIPRNFERITLKEDEYFVLGDNRMNSSDSRVFGAVPRKNIIGRVVLRALPFTVFADNNIYESLK